MNSTSRAPRVMAPVGPVLLLVLLGQILPIWRVCNTPGYPLQLQLVESKTNTFIYLEIHFEQTQYSIVHLLTQFLCENAFIHQCDIRRIRLTKQRCVAKSLKVVCVVCSSKMSAKHFKGTGNRFNS